MENAELKDNVRVYLASYGIKLNIKDIEDVLFGHPNFPSAKSVVDTLDFFGLNSIVLEVAKENYEKIPRPFLLLEIYPESHFRIIQDSTTFNIERLSSIVIVSEKQTIKIGTDSVFTKLLDVYLEKGIFIFGICVLIFFGVTSAIKGELLLSFLIALSFLGILVLADSYILSSRKGYFKRICSYVGVGHCNSPTSSSNDSLLAYLGVSFFFGQPFVFGYFSSFSLEAFSSIYFYFYIPIILLVFALMYINFYVKKTFCTNCLFVQLIVVIQFILVFYNKTITASSSSIIYSLFLHSFFASCSMIYFYRNQRNSHYRSNKVNAEKLLLRGRKFLELMSDNKKLIPYKGEFQLRFGYPNTNNKLSVVVSLDCGPCKELMLRVLTFALQHPELLEIDFYFVVRPFSSRFSVRLRQLCLIDIISNWKQSEDDLYKLYNLFKDERKSNNKVVQPIALENVKSFSEKYISDVALFLNANQITFTPSIIYNGSLLVSEVSISILFRHILASRD